MGSGSVCIDIGMCVSVCVIMSCVHMLVSCMDVQVCSCTAWLFHGFVHANYGECVCDAIHLHTYNFCIVISGVGEDLR